MQPGHDALDCNPDDGYRYEYLPAQAHDLVIAVARKCRAKPEENENEERDFYREPEETGFPQDVSFTQERPAFEKRRPAAKEKYRGQCRDENYVGVFGEEENGKCDTGVLNVKTGNDLRLTLGNIEGCPVGLRNSRDEINDEHRGFCQWLHHL